MTATQIGQLLAGRAEATAQYLLPNGKRHGKEWLAGSVSGEAGSSLKVVLSGSKAGMWCDFSGADSDRGDLLGLWQKARQVTLSTACQEALDWMQVPDEQRNTSQPPKPKEPAPPKAPDQRWLDLQKIMRPGTYADLSALAALRNLSTACLELATRHGQLWFAPVHDSGERHPAWILTDSSRRHAQARKMDGSLWNFNGSHKPAKSKTIWGTDSKWPVGLAEATLPEIAMTEGAPDFLAAWHFIHAKGRMNICRPVCMFGVNLTIGDESLPYFSGKIVRFFPHNDAKLQGFHAALRWQAQLAPLARTHLYDLGPTGAKDLNELVIMDSAMEDES